MKNNSSKFNLTRWRLKNYWTNKTNKIVKFFKTLQFRLLLYFALIIFIGGLFLYLPISLKTNIIQNSANIHKNWHFMDALFVSASAFSDTGLTVTSIRDQFNVFGWIVVLILIQVGGLGLVSMKILLIYTFAKKFSIKDRLFISFEKGSTKYGDSINLIKTAIVCIFFFEILFAIILALYFNFSPKFEGEENTLNLNLHHHFFESLWYGIFHSTSAINNAGFDIFAGNSLTNFKSDYFVQVCMMILIIIGGIGFPIFYEIKNYLLAKKFKRNFHFSLFTKVTTLWYLLVLVFVFVFLVILENLTPNLPNTIMHDPDYSTSDKYMALLFSAVSTRNAGFATVNMQNFSEPSKLVLAISMWIGASACSTGGGIRVTTFAIVFMSIFAFIKRASTINMFKKQIPLHIMVRSMAVAITSLALMLIACFTIYCDTYTVAKINGQTSPIHNVYDMMDIFFEVSSAFGTTGLSTGLTPYLNPVSLIILIILMFIGQMTVSGTLSLLTSSSTSVIKSKKAYLEEDIIVG